MVSKWLNLHLEIIENLQFYYDGIKMTKVKCNFKLTSNGYMLSMSINGIN